MHIGNLAIVHGTGVPVVDGDMERVVRVRVTGGHAAAATSVPTGIGGIVAAPRPAGAMATEDDGHGPVHINADTEVAAILPGGHGPENAAVALAAVALLLVFRVAAEVEVETVSAVILPVLLADRRVHLKP